MGYVLLMVLVFVTGQGQTVAGRFPTEALCLEALAGLRDKIAMHNSTASPPEFIVVYAAACTEIKEAPKGRDA